MEKQQQILIEKIDDRVTVSYTGVDNEETFTLLVGTLWDFINEAPDKDTRDMLAELAKSYIDIKVKEEGEE